MKPKNPRLDEYLGRMERCLLDIPAGDRAEIITEIKSHVLEAMDREPERGVDSILASLGEPETVANKFLMERGLKPARAPRGPIVKWLVIGFLGTGLLIVLSVGILIWKFTPLIKVDETSGRVALLGGLIDVSTDENGIKGNLDITIDGEHVLKKKQKFTGEQNVESSVKELQVKLTNGHLVLEPSSTANKIQYDCTLVGGEKGLEIRTAGGVMEITAKHGIGGECTFKVPSKLKLSAKLNNGELELNELKQAVEGKVNLGKISFKPARGESYRFETSVNTGNSDEFKSSDDKAAHSVELKVNVGQIQNRG